jgi:hypothetical protein
MKNPANPFITLGYAGPEYFCDRQSETDSILGNILGGNPVTITSIRRMGKTGLIHHVLHHLPEKAIGVYCDIQAAENRLELINLLMTAMIRAIPEKSKPGAVIWSFIKQLRPVITFEALSGLPQVTLESGKKNPEPDLESLLRLIQNQPFRMVIALDEFQQITQFPEERTDAWLRGIMQQLNNVTFLFSGSQQHLMNELFNTPSMPLYRSTVFSRIKPIPPNEYSGFACQLFRKGNRQIDPETVLEILNWTRNHTYYNQLLCNRIYASGQAKITTTVWQEEALKLIRDTEAIFFGYRDLLPSVQWQLLKALAGEQKVKAPTANEFISKYALSGSATILQSLKALIKKELVYKDYDDDGTAFYSVYDLLFHHWIRNTHL